MASGNKKVIRRIKANDDASAAQTSKSASDSTSKPTTKKVVIKKVIRRPASGAPTDKQLATGAQAQAKAKPKTKVRPDTKPFILFRPLIALGRYIRDSWHELRQVEWPNRRATWKMTLGVIIFCAFIGVFVLVSDWLSQWLIQEVIL